MQNKQEEKKQKQAVDNLLVTTREQRLQRVRTRAKIVTNGVRPSDIVGMHKVVLIGDAAVGKTSLLLRFADNIFNAAPMSTVGVDFKQKTVKVDDKYVRMQYWDTAGQEKFRSISQSYFRNCDGCIAVYDITRKDSFESVKSQIEQYIAINGKKARNKINAANNGATVTGVQSRKQPHQKPQQNKNKTIYLQTEHSGFGGAQKELFGALQPVNEIQEDKQMAVGSEKVPEVSWKAAASMLHNVILVGTKQDLCVDSTNNTRAKSKVVRQVSFTDAIEFARQAGISGCIEISNRIDMAPDAATRGAGTFNDHKDVFLMSACACVDQAARFQMLSDFNDVQHADLKAQAALSRTFHIGYKRAALDGVPAQSEEGIVQRARLAYPDANDSFYSFRLNAAGHQRRKARPPTEYDGRIYRKPFPRTGGLLDWSFDDGYDDESSEFNRNACC